MANPLVAQGVLNRLRGSVVFASFPSLNVTASFLGEEGIRLALEGEATTFINTMAGAVTSPEPYQVCNLTINLLKTQPLANQFKSQMEQNTLLGDCTVRADASNLSPYQLINSAIQGVRELSFNGKDAGWVVMIKGYYNINSNLWS
jgi:hypothetical protein